MMLHDTLLIVITVGFAVMILVMLDLSQQPDDLPGREPRRQRKSGTGVADGSAKVQLAKVEHPIWMQCTRAD